MDPVNSHSASLSFDHILYYNVIEKLTRQLKAIKDGFKSAGVFDFFSNKKYLVPAIFPRTKDLKYPCYLIVDRICSTSSHEIVSYVKEYVVERFTRSTFIQKMLCAWTGWGVIPESGLKVSVEEDVDFIARTCFNELVIPLTFSGRDVFEHMDLMIESATSGFGAL